jgi:hypothetical protein
MMGGRRLEEHSTDSRNKRMEEKRRRQRRMKASAEGDKDPDWAVASQMDVWMNGRTLLH